MADVNGPIKPQGGPSTLHLLFGTWRGRTSLLVTLALMQAYAIRVVMSVAISPIAKAQGYDKPAQGLVLSAFFVGYMLPQIVGGSLASVHGGKVILTLAILLPSVLTLLTPFAVDSFSGLVLMRVLTGFTEGVTYPAVHALMGRWVPAGERSILLNVMWCGAFLGSAITLPVAGAAAASPGGWQVSFYGYGAVGIAWTAVFWVAGASSPEEHPFIGAEECAEIAGSRVAHAGAPAGGGAHGAAEAPLSLRAIPWRAIFSCAPVLGCFAAHTAHNWTFYLLLTWMPNYLKDRLGFDIEGAAALAMIPYLCCFAGSLASGFLADAFIARGVRVLHVRRGMVLVGECVPAALLIAAGFTNSVPAVVAYLSVSLFFSGMSQTGFACTPLDVAPHLGGTLMGIQNTLATVPGILAPMVAGDLVAAPHDDAVHWIYVFVIAGSVAVAGAVAYVCLADDQLAPSLASPAKKAGGEDGTEREDARLLTIAEREEARSC